MIGFSLTGSTIPAGDGVLIVLDVAGDAAEACLSDIVISDSSGSALETSGDCTTIVIDAVDDNVYGCTDVEACNYNADATSDDGSCDYGTMCWDGSYECDASDCPDQPSGSVEVMFSTSTDIAGFQFDVDGVTLTGAGGGAATEAGFTVSNSASTVVGFSLTGSTIPAGDGVLVVLDVEGNAGDACLSGLVLSDSSGNAIDASIDGCTSIVEANDLSLIHI